MPLATAAVAVPASTAQRPVDFALSYARAGLSVVPIKTDGSKSPSEASWKQYQTAIAGESAIRSWFRRSVGVAVIHGAVSGNSEVVDVDAGDDVFAAFRDEVEARCPGLMARLTVVRTPRPGRQVYYRCEVVEGNQPLASRLDSDGKPKAFIETRGEGGYTLAPGSPAACHPTGRTYARESGPPLEALEMITPSERAALFAAARVLSEVEVTTDRRVNRKPRRVSPGLRPGDDYAQKTEWQDILEPEGWTLVRKVGDVTQWRRPGKDKGTSATTGFKSEEGNDLLCVFSTNAAPFEGPDGVKPCRTYTKFAAFATLKHGGDYHAAAEALAKSGFGDDGPAMKGDAYNGAYFADLYHEQIAYCGPWNKWLVFTDGRWAIDEGLRIEKLGRDAAAKALRKAAEADESRREAVGAWATSLCQRGKMVPMILNARSESGVGVTPDLLDADPWLLNCKNGTVDLKTGAVLPLRSRDLLNKSTGVEYLPSAVAGPHWGRFLQTIFAGSDDLIGFVQRLFGVALVGEVVEHILPIFHGDGANGKSTLLEAIRFALGEYASPAPGGFLLAKKQDGHPTETADLFGRRLVIVSETETGRRLDESLVKRLTGGDSLKARRCHEDFWEFAPSHTLIMATNHRPEVQGADLGIWRRLRLVPFTVTIPPAEQDKTLAAKLRAEAPAILRWCVDGCLAWQRQGLAEPAAVLLATDAYKAESDAFKCWLRDCVEFVSDARTGASSAYESYRDWLATESPSGSLLTQRAFGRRVREQSGVKAIASNGVVYVGMRLKERPTDVFDVADPIGTLEPTEPKG